MVQSVEAWAKKIPLEEYAKEHQELQTALEFWKS
jgi:ribulose 1,5-bisphosphate carboxylase large subunit-like protein